MIRVLIVDDSPFIRSAIKKMLETENEIKIEGEGSNGKEAIELAQKLKPDIITLDIDMPIMDGLSALDKIKTVSPSSAIIMLSALTKEGAEETIEALNKGAFDFVTKPKNYVDFYNVKTELIQKIKAAKQINYRKEIKETKEKLGDFPKKPYSQTRFFDERSIIALGISTGGPQTLNEILPQLPSDFPFPITIAIHMPDNFTKSFAEHLDKKCKLNVKEAEDKEKLERGNVYISRGRINMLIKGTKQNPYVEYHQDSSIIYVPSANLLLKTSADVFGKDTIGIVMTGMGDDGAKGIVEVKNKNGLTIAEDPQSAILWAMPEAAIKTGCVDLVVKKEELAPLLIKIAKEKKYP